MCEHSKSTAKKSEENTKLIEEVRSKVSTMESDMLRMEGVVQQRISLDKNPMQMDDLETLCTLC